MYHSIYGGKTRKEDLQERALRVAKYIVENRCTVRDAAKEFDISKSTIHKDVTERMMDIDGLLYKEVREVLDTNLSERHLRGGKATKDKYMKLRKERG